MRLAVIVLLVACGGGELKDTTPVPAGPTCKTAAGKMGDMIATDIAKPSDDAVNQLIGLIEKRCAKDQWSPAAIRCLAEMRTVEQADQCGTHLTPAQQQGLVDDLPKPSESPVESSEQ